MALTDRRWLAVTVLACAAVAVTYLPPRGFETWPWGDVLTPEYLAARRVGAMLVTEVAALRLLERRDTALAALERTPRPLSADVEQARPPRVGLFVDPAVPPRLRGALENALARAADSLPRGPVRHAAALFLDTATAWNRIPVSPPRQQPDIRYLFPNATDGRTCLTVVTVGPTHHDEALDADAGASVPSPASPAELVGPCGLVAELGPPGPAMASWIRVGLYENEAGLGARCARGDEDACHHLLFRHVDAPPASVGAARFSVRGGSGGFGARFTTFDAALLRSLADSVGAARFASLWRAEGDLAAAFERAAGVPATRWIQELLRPEDPAAFRQGRPPTRGAVLLGIGLVVLAVGVTVGVGWRRQASG